MMRKVFVISVIMFICLTCSFVFAVELTTSTTHPAGAFSVTTTVIDSNGTDDAGVDDTWGTAVQSLNFGALKEVSGVDATTGAWVVFLPANNSYFALDCGFSGGGYTSGKSISVSYSTSPGPNGDLLGKRVILTYKYVTGSGKNTTDNTLTGVDSPDLMNKAKVISVDQLKDGWLRIYAGIYDGKDTALKSKGATTFSPSSPAGDYKGTLTIDLL
jgi:hypothetical protein